MPRRSPDDTIRIVLDDLTGGGAHKRFGVSIEGRSVQATDLDWSYRSGPALRGAAEDPALVLCAGPSQPGGSKASRSRPSSAVLLTVPGTRRNRRAPLSAGWADGGESVRLAGERLRADIRGLDDRFAI